MNGMAKTASLWKRRALSTALPAVVLACCAAAVIYGITRPVAPVRAEPIRARLELAAGEVKVDQGHGGVRAVSGMALHAGAKIATGQGARALVRLPDGSSAFLRGGSRLRLVEGAVELEVGEYWLDVPEIKRDALVHRAGKVTVSAAGAGLSIGRQAKGASVYVARGMAVVTGPGGRVEVNAGERAVVDGAAAPKVEPVAFWDDWTGGMADLGSLRTTLGAGSGTIYGIDTGAGAGSPPRPLAIKSQRVRAVVRGALSETTVDQTFFNPSPRPVEGWYWFVVPAGASVTGFALETNGTLVEGELIERREAAVKYGQAKQSGHAPAILEWVDGRSYRARIFPVPAAGSRRVVLRYVQLRPLVDGKLSYLYPMTQGTAVRIGELSLSVDLGDAGRNMSITTLDEARIEDGGRRVTMRRSGYTPRIDFQLEAKQRHQRPSLSVARFETGGDAADYLMARYTPDVDWAAVSEPEADVVVVVDTSAAGDSAARQLAATSAEAILRSLASNDRFALLSLDVAPTVLHPDKALAPATDEQIAKALEALAGHTAGGATDMAAMFDAALGRVHGAEQPAVIYVGDGRATSGEMSGEQLIERLRRAIGTSRARLFTVGVGADANRALLGELARAGGGRSFSVDVPAEATAQALELVAAVKVPTITDFELDLGAGLDEPFMNVSRKVPRGTDVVLLARTHHDVPKRAVVRGRLGGKNFEREIEVSHDRSVLTAFVPRLWASAYVRRLLGAAAGPEAERGRIVSLGSDYGIVTPFTSILALESETAYQRMGIPRRHSPLRGVRLGALDRRAERNLGWMFDPPAAAPVAFGCSRGSEAAPVGAAAQKAEPAVVAPPIVAAATANAAVDGKRGADVPAAPPAAQAKAAPAADESEVAGLPRKKAALGPGGSLDRDVPERRPRVAMNKGRSEKADHRGRSMRSRPRVRSKPVVAHSTCSDLARRPLAQRMILWRKRLHTARSAPELLQRYQAARRACEIGDWHAERELLRLMEQRIVSEAGAKLLLQSLADRPEVQKFVAKLILRRAVDPRIVAAVQQALFGDALDWNEIDRKLSAIADPAERITALREAMAGAPSDPNGQIRLVELLAEAGQVDEALSLGRRLRERGLTTVHMVRKLGDVLARAGKKDEAVRTYSEIVEFDPHNLPSRLLLGDIYLARGWYGPAYRQYRTATEAAPSDPLGWLRLATAAAGSGRVDEGLRIARQVSEAQGRPGPTDPRRWARLWSAARLGGLIATPPKSHPPSRSSLERRLKELGLLPAGAGTLVIVTWRDLRADLLLETLVDGDVTALGEPTDAAAVGVSAVMLPSADVSRVALRLRLRSLPIADPVAVTVVRIGFEGRKTTVKSGQLELGARATELAL